MGKASPGLKYLQAQQRVGINGQVAQGGRLLKAFRSALLYAVFKTNLEQGARNGAEDISILTVEKG